MPQDENYAERQRRHELDYRRQYADWIASLSPVERQDLADLGLRDPDVPSAKGFAMEPNDSIAPCLPDTGRDDSSREEEPPNPSGEFVHELLRRIVGELLFHDNARLSLECLSLVTGLCYQGNSMTEIARRHGITRAAVSKRCVDLANALALKPSRAMRSLETRGHNRNARFNHLGQSS